MGKEKEEKARQNVSCPELSGVPVLLAGDAGCVEPELRGDGWLAVAGEGGAGVCRALKLTFPVTSVIPSMKRAGVSVVAGVFLPIQISLHVL